MKVLEHLEDYFKMELNDTRKTIIGIKLGEIIWLTVDEAVDAALSRIMGATLFAQYFDENYIEKINELYYYYKRKIEALEEDYDE